MRLTWRPRPGTTGGDSGAVAYDDITLLSLPDEFTQSFVSLACGQVDLRHTEAEMLADPVRVHWMNGFAEPGQVRFQRAKRMDLYNNWVGRDVYSRNPYASSRQFEQIILCRRNLWWFGSGV